MLKSPPRGSSEFRFLDKPLGLFFFFFDKHNGLEFM